MRNEKFSLGDKVFSLFWKGYTNLREQHFITKNTICINGIKFNSTGYLMNEAGIPISEYPLLSDSPIILTTFDELKNIINVKKYQIAVSLTDKKIDEVIDNLKKNAVFLVEFGSIHNCKYIADSKFDLINSSFKTTKSISDALKFSYENAESFIEVAKKINEDLVFRISIYDEYKNVL